MPAGMLQQNILGLQAAAADADSACGIMAAVQAQGAVINVHQLAPAARSAAELTNGQQEDLQQHQRQLEHVQKAVALLRRATAMREQHLAAGNQLSGHSHHATAAAAVEAAVLAGAAFYHGGSGSAALTVKHSLAVLQDSLSMQKEVEVCRVLTQLQQYMEAFVCAGVSREPSRHRSTLDSLSQDVGAILQLPCSCMQECRAQLPDPQHNPAQARAGQASCRSRSAQAASVRQVLQDSLLLAFQHFSGSVAVLACSQPQDFLALAAEKAACCAAGLALVAAQGACCDASPVAHVQGHEAAVVATQQGVGLQSSVLTCCRCSAVSCIAAEMLQDVEGVVALHLGVLG